MTVLRAPHKCPKTTSSWSPEDKPRSLKAEQALELDFEEWPSFWGGGGKQPPLQWEGQQRSGRCWDEGRDKLGGGGQILKAVRTN